jgi:hypothetical protein
VTGGWKKLHNQELHNLYSLRSMIIQFNSIQFNDIVEKDEISTIGGCVHIGYWWESHNEENY